MKNRKIVGKLDVTKATKKEPAKSGDLEVAKETKKETDSMVFLQDHHHKGVLIKKGTLLSDVNVMEHTVVYLVKYNIIGVSL